jgi:hypothetical protein
LTLIVWNQCIHHAWQEFRLGHARRWQIETLFAAFKGHGFNLEDTGINNRLRLKRLLAVMVIAFCLTHRTGEWQHEKVKPIKIKKHQRLSKSIFRVGLDLLHSSFRGSGLKKGKQLN